MVSFLQKFRNYYSLSDQKRATQTSLKHATLLWLTNKTNKTQHRKMSVYVCIVINELAHQRKENNDILFWLLWTLFTDADYFINS